MLLLFYYSLLCSSHDITKSVFSNLIGKCLNWVFAEEKVRFVEFRFGNAQAAGDEVPCFFCLSGGAILDHGYRSLGPRYHRPLCLCRANINVYALCRFRCEDFSLVNGRRQRLFETAACPVGSVTIADLFLLFSILVLAW